MSLFGCIVSIFLMANFGRRTVFLTSYTLLTIALGIVILGMYLGESAMIIVCILAFQVFHQMGAGAVSTIYVAEICTDTGVSISSAIF